MRAEICAEMVSQLAWRSEVWTVATVATVEGMEYCKKKTAEPSAKKRSGRRGRRKRKAADWREVKRWMRVWPLTSGSDLADKRSW